MQRSRIRKAVATCPKRIEPDDLRQILSNIANGKTRARIRSRLQRSGVGR